MPPQCYVPVLISWVFCLTSDGVVEDPRDELSEHVQTAHWIVSQPKYSGFTEHGSMDADTEAEGHAESDDDGKQHPRISIVLNQKAVLVLMKRVIDLNQVSTYLLKNIFVRC